MTSSGVREATCRAARCIDECCTEKAKHNKPCQSCTCVRQQRPYATSRMLPIHIIAAVTKWIGNIRPSNSRQAKGKARSYPLSHSNALIQARIYIAVSHGPFPTRARGSERDFHKSVEKNISGHPTWLNRLRLLPYPYAIWHTMP